MVKQFTKHDGNTRKDASVTMHGKAQLALNEQWEVNLDATPAGIRDDPAGAFLPMAGKNRPTPHRKINEFDH